MKDIVVPPAVSYAVLVLGSAIAFVFVWQAYEISLTFEEADRLEAAYYSVAQ